MEARYTPESVTGAPELSVVAPAHNEEHYLTGAVEALVSGLRARRLHFEVVICENGSSDSTIAVAAALAAAHPEVRWLSLPEANYGHALRAGFLSSVGGLVVNFDVDLVDLAFLDSALDLAAAEDGPDVVIGSKRSPGADDTRPLGRRVVTGVFSAVLRHGFGLRVSDTHGVKLLRRRSMTELVTLSRSGADMFDTELVLRAEQAGRRVVEIPVRVVEQRPARTKVSSRIPRTLLGLVRLRVRLWREPAAGSAGCRS